MLVRATTEFAERLAANRSRNYRVPLKQEESDKENKLSVARPREHGLRVNLNRKRMGTLAECWLNGMGNGYFRKFKIIHLNISHPARCIPQFFSTSYV